MGRLVEMWKDPKNWKSWGIYYCKEDPRLIVPKRIPVMGWTANFAHKMAYPLSIGMILFIMGPIWGLLWIRAGTGTIWTVTILEIIAVCAFCAWMSSEKRHLPK